MIVLVDTDTDQMPELGPQRIWEGGIANHIERWQDWSYDQQWFEVCLIFVFFCIRGGHLTGSADLPTPIPTRCPNSGSGKVVLRVTLRCDKIEDNHQWFEVCLIFDFSSKGVITLPDPLTCHARLTRYGWHVFRRGKKRFRPPVSTWSAPSSGFNI